VIIIRILIAPFVAAGVILCCCGPAAELVPVYLERTPVQIVGGYSIGIPRGGGLQLYQAPYDPGDGMGLAYHAAVEQSVVKIGWNEDFILVERHPLGHWIRDQPDSSHPEWYIVDVSTGLVQCSYSYDAFLRSREKLGVPDTIEMRDAREVYGGESSCGQLATRAEPLHSPSLHLRDT